MKTEAQELILEAHEKRTDLKSIPENLDFSKIKKGGEMFKHCEPLKTKTMKTDVKVLIINAYTLGGELTKQKLGQAFPEYFQTFENGEWVKLLSGSLIRITNLERGEGYGFNRLGNWVEKGKFYSFKTNPELWQRTTEEEVIEAFKKEFEKRGFKEGVKFKSLYSGSIKEATNLDFFYFFDKDSIERIGQLIYSNDYQIYKDGVFAEIVEEEKTIEQRLEAVEQFINEFKNK